jgi:hypothetical protein
MLERSRFRLTYANAMATVAVFLALGGVGYAATALPANSVGTKQLKDNAVTGAKVANQTLTGAKIRASTLGPVPRATHADSATTANTVTGKAGGDLTGAYPNPTIGAGAVTTPMFASGATAPNATDLAGAPSTDYGAVLSGRVNGLGTSGQDFGAPSGISTATGSESSVQTMSPNLPLKVRDLSVQLTAAPGTGNARIVTIDINGVGSGCLIAGSATSCTFAGPASVPANTRLSIVDAVNTGTPAAADLLFGFRLTAS